LPARTYHHVLSRIMVLAWHIFVRTFLLTYRLASAEQLGGDAVKGRRDSACGYRWRRLPVNAIVLLTTRAKWIAAVLRLLRASRAPLLTRAL